MRQRHVRDVQRQRHTDIQLQRGDAAVVDGVDGVWGVQCDVRGRVDEPDTHMQQRHLRRLWRWQRD